MDFKMKKSIVVGIVVACVVLIGLGMFGLSQEYAGVRGATAITSYIPWGLYIALFLFFEATGAGALLFAALGKLERTTRLKLAVAGVVCAACAGLSILPDLGRPLGMWRLFFAPNVTSPLLLDVWLLCATLVFGLVLIIGLRADKAMLAKVGSIGSALFAVLLPLGTAVMFCSIPGKLGWESTAEIGITLVQVVLAGVALVLLMKGAAEGPTRTLSKAAVALIVANAAIMLGEALLLFYRDDFALSSLEAVMFGTYAPLFWLQGIVGMAAPALMLALRKAPSLAAGLALAGILVGKFVYVVRGSIYPTYAELSEGAFIPMLQPSTGPQMIPTYIPTLNEWLVVAAAGALAVLLLTVAYNSKLVPADAATNAEKAVK